MAIQSKEFIGIAEGIKSNELSVKRKIESLGSTISELSGEKRSLEWSVLTLEADLAAAYECSDEDGGRDENLIQALRAQIGALNRELAKVEKKIDVVNGELSQSKAELDRILEEKAQTLFEIQERARITSSNISKTGGMIGAYSGVGNMLRNSMQTTLTALSKAADILDGSISGFIGGRVDGSTASRGGGGHGALSTGALGAFVVGAANAPVLNGRPSAISMLGASTSKNGNRMTPATIFSFGVKQRKVNPQTTPNFKSKQNSNTCTAAVFSDNDGGDVGLKTVSETSKYSSSQMSPNMEKRLANAGDAFGDINKKNEKSTNVNTTPAEVTTVHTNSEGSLNLPQDVTECIRRTITYPHCEAAREITQNAKIGGAKDGVPDNTGKNFTSHNEDHSKQVRIKNSEALAAIVNTINFGRIEREGATGDVRFNAYVDFRVAQAAAEVHDTGMSNHGYSFEFYEKHKVKRDENGKIIVLKQNPRDFDSVRNNHSANSALNVLKEREFYKAIGFTDAQIDEIAVLVYAHSKTKSGVVNLNNRKSWNDCFDRIEALKDKYNADNPNHQISFTRSRFEGELSVNKLGSLATEALALRLGDVSRDSGPGAVSQSGEVISVSQKTKKTVEHPKDWREETQNYEVKRGDAVLEVELLPKQTVDPKIIEAHEDRIARIQKAKQVHIGEQNIVENHTECTHNVLIHTITVNQGNHAPYCTAEALRDHYGELFSAYNLDAVMQVRFNEGCSLETQRKYDDMRRKMYDEKSISGSVANVIIRFPWD